MKFFATILFLLLSFSFVVEYALPDVLDVNQELTLDDDAGKGTEEHETKMEKDAKEKHYSLIDTYIPISDLVNSFYLQQFYFSLSTGYLHQPFTPPDLV